MSDGLLPRCVSNRFGCGCSDTFSNPVIESLYAIDNFCLSESVYLASWCLGITPGGSRGGCGARLRKVLFLMPLSLQS